MDTQKTEATPQHETPKPQKEHRWMEKLVGTWACSSCMAPGPDLPPENLEGTETVRSLGGLWYVAQSTSQMPDGTTGEMVMTLGYDPDKRCYGGTWIGSMMNWLCVYRDGEVDPSGRKLSLYSTGPDFTGKKSSSEYCDVIEFQDDDTRTLTGHVKDEDGTWRAMMKVEYRRTR